MLTFHGKQDLKDQRIAQVRAHRLADQLVKGVYWEDGKGCAVGCTIHSGRHQDYETELGIPVELAYFEDRIFESLLNGQAMMWPERFLQAIPVGVDLRATHINKRFVLALLTDKTRGLLPRIKDAKAKQIGEEIADALRKAIKGEAIDLAYLAYRADLAYLADRADLADLADRADLAYLADRAYRADLADLADRADRADLADLAEILLEVLAASTAASTSVLAAR